MDFVKKELKIRSRIDAVFNKREEDFASKLQFDDYLEEKEDIIFNLVEGNDVEVMEQKIEAYRVANAESIIRNEARKAEEVRQRAAAAAAAAAAVAAAAAPAEAEADAGAAAPEPDRAGVSGTAAAFHGGQDAEPHQGMEYTAAIPTGAAAIGPAPIPLAPVGADGDIKPVTSQSQTSEQWRLMALASGWTPDLPRRKALDEVLGSLLLNLGIEEAM